MWNWTEKNWTEKVFLSNLEIYENPNSFIHSVLKEIISKPLHAFDLPCKIIWIILTTEMSNVKELLIVLNEKPYNDLS